MVLVSLLNLAVPPRSLPFVHFMSLPFLAFIFLLYFAANNTSPTKNTILLPAHAYLSSFLPSFLHEKSKTTLYPIQTLAFPPKNLQTNTNMSTRPCRFFLQGACRNGADCHFYHEGFSGIPRNLLTRDSGMSFSTSVEHNGIITTDIGAAASTGRSTFGTSPASLLSASSSSASSAQTPTSSSSSASTSSNTRPAYAASRPCNWYMAGYCLRGDNCWFSHDRAVIEGRSRGSGSGGVEDITTTSPGQANSEITSSTADAMTNNADNSKSDEDENEDHKCAICFEVPSTFGLLGNTQRFATVMSFWHCFWRCFGIVFGVVLALFWRCCL